MRKKIVYIVSIILSVFVGCGLMYGVVYFFPNVIVERISESSVIVTDEGISAGVDNIYDAVVVVENYVNSTLAGSGTGFVYKVDGNDAYIMTNHHVVDGASVIKLLFTDSRVIEAELVGSDEYADIAVLKVKKSDIISVAKIGSSENTKLGDTVFTIGTPIGTEFAGTVTRGILSGKDRLVDVSISGYNSDWIMNVMQTDAAINPGNSGGPLCNVSGEVIGINSLKIVRNEVEGLGFSIPIEDALEYANSIESGEKIVRAYFGIQMLELSSSYDLMLAGIRIDGKVSEGVVVASVIDDSPASDAKIQKGDIIVKVGEYDVSNIAEFRYYLYKYMPGDKVEIKYYRNGEYNTTKATLEKSE